MSATRLSSFLSCRQRYDFAYQQRLEPIARREALILGRYYQLSLEHGDPEHGARMYAAQQPPPQNQREYDRSLAELAIIEAASGLYLATWGQPQQTEFEYRVRLRNPWTGHYSLTFDLLGAADGVDPYGDGYELIENKLVGQITETSIRKLPLDRQLALERYAIFRATGRKVSRIRYRYMRKPSIRQKEGRKKDKSDAESGEQYADRVRQDYLERPEFYAPPEEAFFVDDKDLVRVEVELWEWAEDMRKHRRSNVWPRNTSFCHEFGGCAFIPMCVGEPGARDLYQKRPETLKDNPALAIEE